MPITYTDPLAHVQSTVTRDKEGNVTEDKDALNKIWTSGLDALGRAIKTTDPLGHFVQNILTARDQAVGFLDGVGRVFQNVFNGLGQNLFTVSPMTGLQRNGQDGASQDTALTDPLANKSTFQQDERGQEIKKTDALNKTVTNTYDDAGRLTKVIDRLGRVREFTYFDNNLLQQETWKDYDGGPVVWTIGFTYNADDQMLTATDNNGTVTWTYDELGREATVQDVWGITRTNTWDAGDRLTDITDTKGGTYHYDYDNANRNTSRQFSATNQQARLDFVYNDRDQVTQVERYSDLNKTNLVGKTINTIDDAGRVTNIDHQNGAGVTRDKFDYQYDNADRVKQEISYLGGTRNYGYDAEGQLTSDETGSYSYDLAGNRSMAGYVTGTGNRLSTEGTWNYTYNDEGNQTTKVKISNTETWNYFYNHKNQLTKGEKKPTSASAIDLRVEYKYDVLGNRIEKSVDADGDGPGTATVTRFAYDGFGNVWADLDTLGNVLTRRLYLDGVDAYFARYSSANVLDWPLQDRLGSVRDWLDNSGFVQDHIDYSGFGKITNETNPSYGDRYTWTSRERDTEINLQYNRARYYDYETGRWISEDPLGFDAGDSNLYRYVKNKPTFNTDPMGKQAWPNTRPPKDNYSPSMASDFLGNFGRKPIHGQDGVSVILKTNFFSFHSPKEFQILKDRFLEAGQVFKRAYQVLKDFSLDEIENRYGKYEDYNILFKGNAYEIFLAHLKKINDRFSGGTIWFRVAMTQLVSSEGLAFVQESVDHIVFQPRFFKKIAGTPQSPSEQLHFVIWEIGRLIGRVFGEEINNPTIKDIGPWTTLVEKLGNPATREELQSERIKKIAEEHYGYIPKGLLGSPPNKFEPWPAIAPPPVLPPGKLFGPRRPPRDDLDRLNPGSDF